MRTITLGGKPYEYEYLSKDRTTICLMCGLDKQADAVEVCVGLVKPAIPNTQENADLRSDLGMAILGDINGRITSLKNSPAPSETATGNP